MADIHPSDAIVAVVGFYSAEVRRLQALLAAQGEGAAELRRQLEELRRLHAQQGEELRVLQRERSDELRDMYAERRQVQLKLGVLEDDRPGALLEQVESKLAAASPARAS